MTGVCSAFVAANPKTADAKFAQHWYCCIFGCVLGPKADDVVFDKVYLVHATRRDYPQGCRHKYRPSPRKHNSVLSCLKNILNDRPARVLDR